METLDKTWYSRQKTARLNTQVSAVHRVNTWRGECSVARALLCLCARRACVACARCATLRVAALRVAHCAWHIPPSVKSQGGYVGACAVCPCDARVCTAALSVCVLWYTCRPFSARGVKARPSPLAEASRKLHPNPKGRHDPTARDTIHQYTPASLPPTLREGDLLRIPGLHCSAQSAEAPPLSSLLDQELQRPEKLRGYPPGEKTTCGK